MKTATGLIAIAFMMLVLGACDPESSTGSNEKPKWNPPQPSFQIVTTSVPQMPANDWYLGTLQASGGTAPYHWELVSGQLPYYVEFTPAGEIAGWTFGETYAGLPIDYPISVRVTDATGQKAVRSITVTQEAATTYYFSRPIGETTVIAIDSSGYMSGGPMARARSRAVSVLPALSTQLGRFEVMSFTDAGTDGCFGGTQLITPGNIALATNYINSLTPIGGLPQLYSAVHDAMTLYGPAHVEFISGSYPGPDAALQGATPSFNQIISASAGWRASIPVVNTHGAGTSLTVNQFLDTLARVNLGTYSQIP